jgi:hypothetical protein
MHPSGILFIALLITFLRHVLIRRRRDLSEFVPFVVVASIQLISKIIRPEANSHVEMQQSRFRLVQIFFILVVCRCFGKLPRPSAINLRSRVEIMLAFLPKKKINKRHSGGTVMNAT